MGEMIERVLKPWSMRETDMLMSNYPTMGYKVWQLFPDRSKSSVIRKAENIGLKKNAWSLPDPETYDPGILINNLKFSESIALVLIGDWHISPLTNEAELMEWLKWIYDNETVTHRGKEYLVKVIVMGDMMENGLLNSIGTSVWHQKYTPQNQKKIVIGLLAKIADKIIGCHGGNHEYRTTKVSGMEPIRDICEGAKIPQYGYGTFTSFRLGQKQNYDIYTWHGKSGAQFTHTKLNACIKAGTAVDADVIAMGHVHDKASTTRQLMTAKGMREKRFIITGHFLKWADSYAQQSGMSIGKDGAVTVFLNNDRWDIDVEA